MNKVTIPREVAEAIEYAKSVHTSLTNILNDVFNCGGSEDSKILPLVEYFGGNEELLMSALVNGYEIEQTPEERLRDIFIGAANDRLSARSDGEYYVGMMDGIRTALNTLGIKIVGINVYDGDRDK